MVSMGSRIWRRLFLLLLPRSCLESFPLALFRSLWLALQIQTTVGSRLGSTTTVALAAAEYSLPSFTITRLPLVEVVSFAFIGISLGLWIRWRPFENGKGGLECCSGYVVRWYRKRASRWRTVNYGPIVNVSRNQRERDRGPYGVSGIRCGRASSTSSSSESSQSSFIGKALDKCCALCCGCNYLNEFCLVCDEERTGKDDVDGADQSSFGDVAIIRVDK